MRSAAAIVFFILVAGCAGPSNPTVPDVPHRAPVLDVLVTDDEWVPIQGATVFLLGSSENHTTDRDGIATLPMPDGSFLVRAWAPSHYRGEARGATTNESTRAHVILPTRPDDVRAETLHRAEGFCQLGIPIPGQPVPCTASPRCSVPFADCGGPYPSVRVPLGPTLGDGFQNVTVRLTWEAETFSETLAFIVRLMPNHSFADGNQFFTVAGKSPLSFSLTRDDLGPDVPTQNTDLWLGSQAPGEPEAWDDVPVVFSQEFQLEARVLEVFELPPSVPW